MRESFEEVVERTIDWVIRSFRPDEPATFDDCDSELRRVEDLLSAVDADSSAHDLLGKIRAARIFLAADIGDAEEVVRKSGDFLERFPSSSLDSCNVRVLRLRALHALGQHSDELREGLDAAKDPEVRDWDFVLLLEGIAKRHPGSLGSEVVLQEKMTETLRKLDEEGYANLPSSDQVRVGFEQAVLDTAAEYRRVSEERTMAILAEEGY